MLTLCGTCTRYYYMYNQNYCQDIKAEFIKAAFSVSKELVISKKVLTFVSKELREDYNTFAKYDEAYHNTDLTIYPNKRIILNGVSQDEKTAFIFYERGGHAIHYFLIICRFQRNEVLVARFDLKARYENVEDLKAKVVNEECF